MVRCNKSIESIELSKLCEKCFKHLKNNDMDLIHDSSSKLTDTGSIVMTLIDKVVTELQSDNVKDESNNNLELEPSEIVLVLATLADDSPNKTNIMDEAVPSELDKLHTSEATLDQIKESEDIIKPPTYSKPHDVSQENPNQTQDLDTTIDTGRGKCC